MKTITRYIAAPNLHSASVLFHVATLSPVRQAVVLNKNSRVNLYKIEITKIPKEEAKELCGLTPENTEPDLWTWRRGSHEWAATNPGVDSITAYGRTKKEAIANWKKAANWK